MKELAGIIALAPKPEMLLLSITYIALLFTRPQMVLSGLFNKQNSITLVCLVQDLALFMPANLLSF